MSNLTRAAEMLRASKNRWGSYAIDHDAIDALRDLLIVIERADYDNPSSTIEHIEDTATALATAILQEPS